MKLKNFDKALRDCDACLKIESNNVKAMNRKGQALFGLEKHNEAYDVFEDVLEIDPQNSVANQELFSLKKILPPRNAFR